MMAIGAHPKWIVCIKGAHDTTSWEISVVKSDYTHGQNSYGWFGENKHLISHDGGPCRVPVSKLIWNKLVRVASEVAEEFNNFKITDVESSPL